MVKTLTGSLDDDPFDYDKAAQEYRFKRTQKLVEVIRVLRRSSSLTGAFRRPERL